MAFPIRSRNELQDEPDMAWLVGDILAAKSLCVLHGKPKTGKSFVALDLACSVDTGVPFAGCAVVSRGNVLYVVGEGGGGFNKRLSAWERHHGVTTSIYTLKYRLDIPEGRDPKNLVQQIEEMGIGFELVIIDTLARNFGQSDENQTHDMNRFVAGCDLLKECLNCTVLVVHHDILDGKRMRGNSALEGALDTKLKVERAPRSHTCFLTVEMQKDAEEKEEVLGFQMMKDEAVDSVVVVYQPDSRPPEPKESGTGTKKKLRNLMKAAGSQGITVKDIVGNNLIPGVGEPGVRKALRELRDAGEAHQPKRGVYAVSDVLPSATGET